MNSSAVWERDDSPGPILSDGKFMRAWSDRVGDPNSSVRPNAMALLTNGCSLLILDELRRN